MPDVSMVGGYVGEVLMRVNKLKTWSECVHKKIEYILSRITTLVCCCHNEHLPVILHGHANGSMQAHPSIDEAAGMARFGIHTCLHADAYT